MLFSSEALAFYVHVFISCRILTVVVATAPDAATYSEAFALQVHVFGSCTLTTCVADAWLAQLLHCCQTAAAAAAAWTAAGSAAAAAAEVTRRTNMCHNIPERGLDSQTTNKWPALVLKRDQQASAASTVSDTSQQPRLKRRRTARGEETQHGNRGFLKNATG